MNETLLDFAKPFEQSMIYQVQPMTLVYSLRLAVDLLISIQCNGTSVLSILEPSY